MNCNKIRTMIDEADGQGNIPFEAARHIQTCEACNKFADERAKLFEVLNSVGRITAPPDFQVTLRRRLRERTAAQAAPWYAHAFNLKLAGALAAMLICTLFLVQFLGYRGSPGNRAGSSSIAQDVSPRVPEDNQGVRKQPGLLPPSTGRLMVTPASPTVNPTRVVMAKHRITHERNDELAMVIPAGRMLRMPTDPRQEAAAFMLVRGESTEQQIVIPAVSLGAQPLYYPGSPSSNAGRVSF